MKPIKIAIGSDHAGFDEKENIKEQLAARGFEIDDRGCFSTDSVDYPDIAYEVGKAVAKGDANLGILVCGSGTGMAIAANKVKGIRAAVAWNEETARLAREHNNANILAIGARTSPEGSIPAIVDAWLDAEFGDGRHAIRIGKISKIEEDIVKSINA